MNLLGAWWVSVPVWWKPFVIGSAIIGVALPALLWKNFLANRGRYPARLWPLMLNASVKGSLLFGALPFLAVMPTLDVDVWTIVRWAVGVYAAVYGIVLYRRRAPIHKIALSLASAAIVLSSVFFTSLDTPVVILTAALMQFQAVSLDRKRVDSANAALQDLGRIKA